jgi:hypothetical protein
MSDSLRIDATNVMHETIDGEVVVIHLDSGTYYSFDAVGAHVWEALATGATLEALVESVVARYRGDPEAIAAGVGAFVERLREESLVVVDPLAGEPAAPAPPAAPSEIYAAPVLQKYTDMEQLLLLDPIHEVEDAGWPNAK